jgi:hypothetical protein
MDDWKGNGKLDDESRKGNESVSMQRVADAINLFVVYCIFFLHFAGVGACR